MCCFHKETGTVLHCTVQGASILRSFVLSSKPRYLFDDLALMHVNLPLLNGLHDEDFYRIT